MTDGAAATARDWADAGADLGDDTVAASFAQALPVRPVIEVCAGKLHMIATEAENALILAEAPLYVRGGLVRPIVDDLPAANGRRTKVARLAQVDGPTLVDHLSRCADFVKFDGRKKATVPTDPSKDLVRAQLRSSRGLIQHLKSSHRLGWQLLVQCDPQTHSGTKIGRALAYAS